MNNLNSVLLEGVLVKDPELTYSSQGLPFCNFELENRRDYKQKEETIKEKNFFTIHTASRLAEVCAEYLKKKRGVRIVGKLSQDRWTDVDGVSHERVFIFAEHVEFQPVKKEVSE